MTIDEHIAKAEEDAKMAEFDSEWGIGNYFIDRTEALEYAKECRQLAEWLKELKAYREFADWLVKAVLEEDWEDSSDFYAEVLCRKLTKLGKLKVVDNKYMEVNADEDSD